MRLSLAELEEMAARRSPAGLLAISEAIARTGGCAQPVRLKANGRGSPSVGQPEGVVLVACKTRRETRCPSCAETYKGDAKQLVRAGIEGGKGVPETVSGHPAVFVTLTAPGFGAVHRAVSGQCHPVLAGRCHHGRDLFCPESHAEPDEVVGTPLCPDCYDYEAAVMFNASVTALWHRVTIYARRHLAYVMGMTERQLRTEVRLSYLKVAELQARGVVHLHAIVRADSAGEEVEPPGIAIRSDLLAEAIVRAAQSASVGAVAEGQVFRFAFGEQVTVDPLKAGDVAKIASYLSKYLVKSASGTAALDHRLREGELDHIELPDHLRRIVATAWRLGSSDGTGRLRRRAHALGYPGHLLTKSPRFSTTFGKLQQARAEWHKQDADDARPEDHSHLSWEFAGAGHTWPIDHVIAATVAAQRDQSRRVAWEELTSVDGD